MRLHCQRNEGRPWSISTPFSAAAPLCAIGQILIDKTSPDPRPHPTGYVVAGVLLGALGLYEPLVDGAVPAPPCR